MLAKASAGREYETVSNRLFAGPSGASGSSGATVQAARRPRSSSARRRHSFSPTIRAGPRLSTKEFRRGVVVSSNKVTHLRQGSGRLAKLQEQYNAIASLMSSTRAAVELHTLHARARPSRRSVRHLQLSDAARIMDKNREAFVINPKTWPVILSRPDYARLQKKNETGHVPQRSRSDRRPVACDHNFVKGAKIDFAARKSANFPRSRTRKTWLRSSPTSGGLPHRSLWFVQDVRVEVVKALPR